MVLFDARLYHQAQQYDLILDKGWCCCLAGKVTVGLVEGNGNLLLSL